MLDHCLIQADGHEKALWGRKYHPPFQGGHAVFVQGHTGQVLDLCSGCVYCGPTMCWVCHGCCPCVCNLILPQLCRVNSSVVIREIWNWSLEKINEFYLRPWEAPLSVIFIIPQAASPGSRRLTLWDESPNITLHAVSFQICIYLSHYRKVLNTVIVAKISIVFKFCII